MFSDYCDVPHPRIRSLIYSPSVVLRFSTKGDETISPIEVLFVYTRHTTNAASFLTTIRQPAKQWDAILSNAHRKYCLLCRYGVTFVTLPVRGCHRFYAKTASVTFPNAVRTQLFNRMYTRRPLSPET